MGRLENVPQLAGWARSPTAGWPNWAKSLIPGALVQVTGFGLQRHWALARDEQKGLLCVGFRRTLPTDKVDQTMKHVFTKWVS